MTSERGETEEEYEERFTNLFEEMRRTTPADDVDMLVHVIYQLLDGLDATAKIPDPNIHQKYWTEISANELADLVDEKYKNRKRIRIPEEFLTSY